MALVGTGHTLNINVIHSELFQLLKRAMLCKYFFFKDKHFDERRTNQET